jgi:hypothetical protein
MGPFCLKDSLGTRVAIAVLDGSLDPGTLEWNKLEEPKIKGRIAEMGVWIIGGFCVGLRVGEMLLIKFSGSLNILKHMEDLLP